MKDGLLSHLLVAVSGSGASVNAARYAIVMAKLYRCSLTGVYVVDTATLKQLSLSKIFLPEESEDYAKSLEENGRRYLDFVEELAKARGVQFEKVLRFGNVATEIMTTAQEKNADLIILGGWEKDRDPRDIVGQTHREIQVNSKVSVLVVKDRDIEQIYRRA
ncbi:MAG: universal stress protein [Spirochaetaceae bacterium]|jgi:nucleotide-binding universal stress UspA family protein|nr:universal stress protein [Spirochaetaceae bacterium]